MGFLLLLLLASAQAADLAEPEAFGHLADNSVPRPGAVAAPEWRPRARPGNAPLTLAAPTETTSSSSIVIPTPAASAPERKAPRRRRGPFNPSDLILIGAGALLLAGLSLPRGSPVGAAPARLEVLLAPPRRPAERPAPPFWPALPEPPPLRLEPRPVLPWWAVSDAEQEAVYRWEAGAQGLALADWLDAHRDELSGVDVERLKAKLSRESSVKGLSPSRSPRTEMCWTSTGGQTLN